MSSATALARRPWGLLRAVNGIESWSRNVYIYRKEMAAFLTHWAPSTHQHRYHTTNQGFQKGELNLRRLGKTLTSQPAQELPYSITMKPISAVLFVLAASSGTAQRLACSGGISAAACEQNCKCRCPVGETNPECVASGTTCPMGINGSLGTYELCVLRCTCQQ